MYINLKNALYVVVDFHYQYFDMSNFHETFINFENWTSFIN